MKRFYCTRCQKIKRVQKMPGNVAVPDAKDVNLRIGQCRFHDSSQARDQVNDRARVHQTFLFKKKISATVQKAKSKRK